MKKDFIRAWTTADHRRLAKQYLEIAESYSGWPPEARRAAALAQIHATLALKG